MMRGKATDVWLEQRKWYHPSPALWPSRLKISAAAQAEFSRGTQPRKDAVTQRPTLSELMLLAVTPASVDHNTSMELIRSVQGKNCP